MEQALRAIADRRRRGMLGCCGTASEIAAYSARLRDADDPVVVA